MKRTRFKQKWMNHVVTLQWSPDDGEVFYIQELYQIVKEIYDIMVLSPYVDDAAILSGKETIHEYERPQYKHRTSDGRLYKSRIEKVGKAYCETCKKHMEDCKCPTVHEGGGIVPAFRSGHVPSDLDEHNYSSTKENTQ